MVKIVDGSQHRVQEAPLLRIMSAGKRVQPRSQVPAMSRWTDWRKLADSGNWYPDELTWDGPACYELGIAGPRGGRLRVVYVGETDNERRRLSCYARSGSHLAELIDTHLGEGLCLYYRAQALPSKGAAFAMQNRLLLRFQYEWNKQLNHRS